MTSGNLGNYYRDEVNDYANENNLTSNYRVNNSKITTSKSFEYKAKIIGNTPCNTSRFDPEVLASLKCLSNFWRSLHLPIVICKIELDLSLSRNCIISEISRAAAVMDS